MRFIYFIFFFFSFLLILPVNSFAALPTGVIQAASVTGTAVTVAGVGTAIIPASAVSGLPAVGTASATAVSVPAIVPITVGGVALAGGYAIGASLVADIPAIRNMVESLPDKYSALKDAFTTTPPAFDGSPSLSPGSVMMDQDTNQNWEIIAFQGFISCFTWGIVNDKCTVNGTNSCSYYNGGTCSKFNLGSVPNWQEVYSARPTTLAVTPTPSTLPPTDAEAAERLTNPDGTLTPAANNDLKAALASGDLSASGATLAGTTTGITPELLQLYSRLLAAQNATDVNNATVEALETAVNADPTNVALQNQLAEAQSRLAESQAAQAAQEAALAAETAAAETATANLGPANTYDTSLDIPVKKEIPSLLNSVFDNSPLLGMVRSFQISTTDQQAVFNIGHFYGQDLVFDFTRWASVLAACGTILLVLSHAYAVFIVVKGG